MSALLKCDKADNVALIEFIMLTDTSSFHLSALTEAGVNVCELTTALNATLSLSP